MGYTEGQADGHAGWKVWPSLEQLARVGARDGKSLRPGKSGGPPGEDRNGAAPQGGSDLQIAAWGSYQVCPPPAPLPHRPRSDPRGECSESCGCYLV